MKLPDPQHSTEAVLDKVIKETEEVRHSNGVPISSLGDDCERKLWYDFRHVQDPKTWEPRMLRLFRRGKVVELEVVQDLKDAGLEIHDLNQDGNQWRVEDYAKHLSGYVDGVGRGFPECPTQWCLMEVKSHKNTSFNSVKKHGVLKSNYKHFVQCQMGMGMSKPVLKSCIYIAYCKNTSAMYVERIKFDKVLFESLKEKALRIIQSSKPLERVAKSENDYRCKSCDYAIRCHLSASIQILPNYNCRTCCFSTPDLEKGWVCEKHNKTLSKDAQSIGCGDHLYNPFIMPYEVIKAEQDSITYLAIDGQRFINKKGKLEIV